MTTTSNELNPKTGNQSFYCTVPLFETYVEAGNLEEARLKAYEAFERKAAETPIIKQIEIADRKEVFPITDLCRSDLLEVGFTEEQANKLTDQELNFLACDLSEDYVGNCFLQDLDDRTADWDGRK